jgi:predicted Zn-dependent peptidase
MLIFGRPVPPEEVVAKIDAIDAAAVRRVAERVFRTAPTLAALGPVGRLESYDAIRARIG